MWPGPDENFRDEIDALEYPPRGSRRIVLIECVGPLFPGKNRAPNRHARELFFGRCDTEQTGADHTIALQAVEEKFESSGVTRAD